MRDPVVMNHPAIPGQEDKTVERSSYRVVWYERGWRSADDPDYTGDPGDPASWLTGEVVNRRLRLSRTEGVTTPAAGTTVLADLDGSGVVTSVWVAAGTGTAGRDMVFSVYVDGETDPAVTADLGTLFGSHYATTGDWSCDHVQGSANSTAMGGMFTYPMPYSDGIRIEITNPTATGIVTFGQVAYSDERPPGYRLRSAGSTRLAPDTVAQAATFEFMDIEGAGWLVYHSVAGTGVSASTWLERDVEIQIDGEVTPSFAATGLEDWFGGAWFWYGRQFISTPFAFVAVNGSNRAVTAVDLLKWHQGIRFNESVRVVLGTEANVTTDHTMSWCMLYYLDVRSADPEPDVPPPPAATVLDLPGTSGAYVTTPAVAALDISGDIDIRVEINMDDSTPASDQVLISKWGAVEADQAWQLFITTTGAVAFRTRPTGGGTALTLTSDPGIMPTGRVVLRYTLDVDNGATKRVGTIYTGDTVDDTTWTQIWTQEGSASSIAVGAAPITIGALAGGATAWGGLVYAAEIRDGLAGTVVANPDFTALTPGAGSLVDGTGKTWTVNSPAVIAVAP